MIIIQVTQEENEDKEQNKIKKPLTIKKDKILKVKLIIQNVQVDELDQKNTSIDSVESEEFPNDIIEEDNIELEEDLNTNLKI